MHKRGSTMLQPDSYIIGPIPGFSPGVGRLAAMMTYARWTTMRAVEGLTMSQLDHLRDETSNSISALHANIASVEVGSQHATLGGRSIISAKRDDEWTDAEQL